MLSPSRYQASQEIKTDQRRFKIPKKKRELEAIVELEMERFVPPQPREDESLDPEDRFKCCTGSSTDKRLLLFIANLSISLMVIVFCCYMLSRVDINCESQHVYVGLLSAVVFYWVKSPV